MCRSGRCCVPQLSRICGKKVSCSVSSGLFASSVSEKTKVSRRNLLGGGAALLSLLTVPALGRSAPASAPEVSSVKAGSDDSAHMTVDVMLNGKGPYRFVVDTGAERTVVSSTVARILALPHVKDIRIEGVTRPTVTETVRVADLTLGEIQRKDMEIPVLPDSWLQADGYIGLDTLGENRIILDFKNHKLSVVHGGDASFGQSCSPGFGDVASRLHLRTRNCLVDQVNTTVFIDTGAEVTVGNYALLDALKHTEADFRFYRGAASLYGVTGGDKDGALLNFDKLRVADVALDDGNIVISPLPVFTHWKLTDKPALILGMDFMRRFDRIMVDYRGGAFRFGFEGLHDA